MSQVLITGATGLVGDHLLRLLIQDRRVNYIAAPTRRPLADLSGVFNPHDPQLPDAERTCVTLQLVDGYPIDEPPLVVNTYL